jgi:holliday junction DNA helicase RuvA
MIGSIRGKIILKDGNNLLIETNGVGYKVLVSGKITSTVNVDSNIFIYTFTHVKEDVLELFGFLEIEDLKLFENLISVSGVGPKTAMSIFSYISRNDVINAVIKGDSAVFNGIPRLGKKNAQKIIIELKSKLGDDGSFELDLNASSENDEVINALKSFGFSHKEIVESLKNVDVKASTSEEKIKLALKHLGK